MSKSKLQQIAATRWLRTEEIVSLLRPETCSLQLSTDAPSSPPPSGTLLLYDRSQTRNFKDDGHDWVKRKGNALKVREDHVKLRLGGREVVTAIHAHSTELGTMHRRAYRLIANVHEPPTEQIRKQKWVLVHYLDEAEASRELMESARRRSAATVDSDVSEDEKVAQLSVRVDESNTAVKITTESGHSSTSSNSAHQNQKKRKRKKSSSVDGITEIMLRNMLREDESIDKNNETLIPSNGQLDGGGSDAQQDAATSSSLDEHIFDCDPKNGLVEDDEIGKAIDFFFPKIRINDSILPAAARREPGFGREENPQISNMALLVASKEQPYGQAARKGVQNESGAETRLCDGTLCNTIGSNRSSFSFSSGSPRDVFHVEKLASIIDITPSEALIGADAPAPIVISTSISLPELPLSDTVSHWQYFAVFMKVYPQQLKIASARGPRVSTVAPAEMLTSFSYKCYLSSGNNVIPPERTNVMIIAAHMPKWEFDTAQTWEPVRLATENLLKTRWTRLCSKNEGEAKVSTAIKMGSVHTSEGNMPSRSQDTALSSSICSVLSRERGSLIYEDDEHKERSSTTQEISIFLLTSASFVQFCFLPNHSRTDSTQESSESNRWMKHKWAAPPPMLLTVASALERLPLASPHPLMSHDVATDWAFSYPANKFVTNGDLLSRYLFVSFYGLLIELLPENRREGAFEYTTAHGDVVANFYLCENFSSIDDWRIDEVEFDELENMLGLALITFVGFLIESSDYAARQEENVLNHRCEAGFALLHFAALFNRPELVSLLVSRGADPDLPTSTGGLTALHLAAGAGHMHISSLLIGKGCDVDATDRFGLTAAHHAVRNCFFDLARWASRKMTTDIRHTPGKLRKFRLNILSSEQRITPTDGVSSTTTESRGPRSCADGRAKSNARWNRFISEKKARTWKRCNTITTREERTKAIERETSILEDLLEKRPVETKT